MGLVTRGTAKCLGVSVLLVAWPCTLAMLMPPRDAQLTALSPPLPAAWEGCRAGRRSAPTEPQCLMVPVSFQRGDKN